MRYDSTSPEPETDQLPSFESIDPIERANGQSLSFDAVSEAGETRFPVRRLLGLGVRVCSRDQAFELLLARLRERQPTKLAFANMHLLSQIGLGGFEARMLDGFIVLNDGLGVDIASRMLFGRPFPANLNGTDLVPALLELAGKDTRVFLYGATPEIVARAAKAISVRCGVAICGTCDGYGVAIDPSMVVAHIRHSCADVVLVALGNPRQEIWIENNAHALGAPLVIGVGAFFDIVSDAYPRAPAWIRRVIFEHLKFARQKRDPAPPAIGGPRYEVELEIADAQHRVLHRDAAPGQSLDSRQELSEGERLDKVVVTAGAQAADTVIDLAERAHDQRRRCDSCIAQPANDADPVDTRQHPVDRDDRVLARVTQMKPVISIRREVDMVAACRKKIDELSPCLAVVLDHKNAMAGSHELVLPRGKGNNT